MIAAARASSGSWLAIAVAMLSFGAAVVVYLVLALIMPNEGQLQAASG